MDEMFQLAWKRYRTWAATSRRLKAANEKWKRRVLVLTLVGTAFGTLAPLAGQTFASPRPTQVLAVCGAVCLALATYFGKELLDSRHEEAWTRSRTAAEALKSETQKYVVQAPPYDSDDRAAQLGARLTALELITKDQIPDTLGPADATQSMPTTWWTIEDYLSKRLTEQIEFYRTRASEYAVSMRRGRTVAVALGVTAVLLSAVAGAAEEGSIAAALLGLVTTTGGAIGAYFQASHYEGTALKYRETADALERRRAEFATTPEAERHQLVADAETVMQAEHSAWLAERTAKTS